MKRITITLELNGDSPERRYRSLDTWLRNHRAVQVMPTLWILITALTVDEIRRELEAYVDPSDRLLVTQVGPMSFRNPINAEFGRGAA